MPGVGCEAGGAVCAQAETPIAASSVSTMPIITSLTRAPGAPSAALAALLIIINLQCLTIRPCKNGGEAP